MSDKLSVKFFLSILENSNDLISIIDATGNYKFVAGSVKTLLGYTPKELEGTSAFMYIHEDDQALAAAALQAAMYQKHTLVPPFRFRTKVGSYQWIECTVTDMLENAEVQGYVTNSRIITQQIIEAEKKKKNRAHYESLFYNHPDAVFELSKEGFFTRVNKSVSKVLEYDEEKIIGTHFNQFVHQDFMPVALNAFERTMYGGSEYLEISVVRKSGAIAVLGITVFPVIIDNEIVSLQAIAKDITLQKKYDDFLRAQSELVNSIMGRISESFYSLDENWRYTYVNKYYTTYLGRSQEELLGNVIWDVFPLAKTTQFYHECHRVAETGIPAFFEERIPYLLDSILSFQIFPATKGIAVHIVDITERKKEQDRLEKLALVASKSTTSVMIKDAQRRIEWVNQAFENATGYTLSECYMQSCPELLMGKESNGRLAKKIIRKMEDGKSFQGEFLNYTKSGTKIWFYMQTTPVFDESGVLTKYVTIGTDITERKLREEELVQVARELYQQNVDLQQFSHMVSHNLRAPAANLMGLTSILGLADKNSQMFTDTLTRMKESSSTLDHVIRDMNHILTIRERNRELDLEEVDVNDVLVDLIKSMRFEEQDFKYRITVQGDKRIKTLTNRVYLYEILRNLLSNAIKFRKTTEPLLVAISLKFTDAKTELSISDNGIGMDIELVKHELFRLYKKFHRGYEGRGIGLFLVKNYLDALGGSIKLKSQPGEGTIVKIKLRSDARQSVSN